MTYLEARRVETLFKTYRQLALDYWAAVEPINYGPNAWMAGPGAATHKDTEKSKAFRVTLSTLEPEVQLWAGRLGAAVGGQSFPPPAVGGPVLPFNLLQQVTNQWVGHSAVPRQDVLDAIDKCIGAAAFHRRRIGWRLVKPWCWLIDIPAVIVGWPFQVMRKAGVPSKLIESTGAQFAKVILTGMLYIAGVLYVAYKFGLQKAIEEVLK